MGEIFIIVVSVVVALFIALPLFKSRFGSDSSDLNSEFKCDSHSPRHSHLISQKESLYSALKEIEFDYDLGKLSEDDYQELKNRYKKQAVSVLKKIDEIEQGTLTPSLEGEIEIEIEAARRAEYDEEIEREIIEARDNRSQKSSPNFCPECGNKKRSVDLFCSNCGVHFHEQESQVS